MFCVIARRAQKMGAHGQTPQITGYKTLFSFSAPLVDSFVRLIRHRRSRLVIRCCRRQRYRRDVSSRLWLVTRALSV